MCPSSAFTLSHHGDCELLTPRGHTRTGRPSKQCSNRPNLHRFHIDPMVPTWRRPQETMRYRNLCLCSAHSERRSCSWQRDCSTEDTSCVLRLRAAPLICFSVSWGVLTVSFGDSFYNTGLPKPTFWMVVLLLRRGLSVSPHICNCIDPIDYIDALVERLECTRNSHRCVEMPWRSPLRDLQDDSGPSYRRHGPPSATTPI
ncbi:hypothetical protein PYCCODRAFT_704989 [Trametes coccinea BRFM310]|uniref:Uncharacterized protein n=1 Tax=Trametes coccinea (strain BRFM310) TaxID=1353009 RepID=A0A1Y2IGH0_TRAC3|nr:hypothetical protein PYCCODRAFT_704989 [Trametes coccinea BRFM310]